MEQLLTPDELATRLAPPVATLKYWRASRQGPPAMRVGRHIRYRPSDVDTWLRGLGAGLPPGLPLMRRPWPGRRRGPAVSRARGRCGVRQADVMQKLWDEEQTEARGRLARIERGEMTAPERVVRILRVFVGLPAVRR